jgi:hypothetical protein
MSLYRPKGSKIWVMDFMFHGQRIRETTGTASKSRACRVEQKRRNDLAEGAAGMRKQDPPRLLSVAADEWIEARNSPGQQECVRSPRITSHISCRSLAKSCSWRSKLRMSRNTRGRD